MDECEYYSKGKKCTSMQVYNNPIKYSGYCNAHYIQVYAYNRQPEVQNYIPTKRFTPMTNIDPLPSNQDIQKAIEYFKVY